MLGTHDDPDLIRLALASEMLEPDERALLESLYRDPNAEWPELERRFKMTRDDLQEHHDWMISVLRELVSDE